MQTHSFLLRSHSYIYGLNRYAFTNDQAILLLSLNHHACLHMPGEDIIFHSFTNISTKNNLPTHVIFGPWCMNLSLFQELRTFVCLDSFAYILGWCVVIHKMFSCMKDWNNWRIRKHIGVKLHLLVSLPLLKNSKNSYANRTELTWITIGTRTYLVTLLKIESKSNNYSSIFWKLRNSWIQTFIYDYVYKYICRYLSMSYIKMQAGQISFSNLQECANES